MAKGKVIRLRSIISKPSLELLKEINTFTRQNGYETTIGIDGEKATYVITGKTKGEIDVFKADSKIAVYEAVLGRIGGNI